MALSRLPLARIGLGVSASWWTEAGADSYFISPYVERVFGNVRTSISWQRYDADAASPYESAVASFSLPLPGNVHAMIRASTQWGSGSSQRVFMTLSRSF